MRSKSAMRGQRPAPRLNPGPMPRPSPGQTRGSPAIQAVLGRGMARQRPFRPEFGVGDNPLKRLISRKEIDLDFLQENLVFLQFGLDFVQSGLEFVRSGLEFVQCGLEFLPCVRERRPRPRLSVPGESGVDAEGTVFWVRGAKVRARNCTNRGKRGKSRGAQGGLGAMALTIWARLGISWQPGTARRAPR